jgi:thioredoxin-related protein
MQMRKYFKTIVWRPGLLAVVLLFSGAGPRPTAGAGGIAVALAGGARLSEDAVAGGAVGWMTVEQAAEKLQQDQRPVLIDLYTTWCGWCREMDRKTYSSKKVAAYLGEKFYTVKVDAETRAEITWQGRTYAYNPQYRSNEFAVFLTHGRLEFPTTIIIPPGEAPQAIPGFMEPGDLEPLVKYFGEGAYKTQGFDVYMKNFKKSW